MKVIDKYIKVLQTYPCHILSGTGSIALRDIVSFNIPIDN